MLTIALSKGRIFDAALPLLKKAGVVLSDEEYASRKLIIPTNHSDVQVIVLRATDVPVFVQHGVADLGVAGSDVLLEHGSVGIYELLDLNIAKCRLCLAAKPNADLTKIPLRVATKYPHITQSYFQKHQQQIELIKLYGSMELAAMTGLSACIVDLVDTGRTLAHNNLEVVDEIISVSSRLIANVASYKTKNKLIKQWLKCLRAAND